jgi:hypothetical protein
MQFHGTIPGRALEVRRGNSPHPGRPDHQIHLIQRLKGPSQQTRVQLRTVAANNHDPSITQRKGVIKCPRDPPPKVALAL